MIRKHRTSKIAGELASQLSVVGRALRRSPSHDLAVAVESLAAVQHLADLIDRCGSAHFVGNDEQRLAIGAVVFGNEQDSFGSEIT